MNKSQTLKLLATLKVAYPSFYQNAGTQELDDVVELWTAMFAEDDPQLVTAAAKAFIATDTKGYPPHIGAIKERMRFLTKEDMPTPLEAWNGIWKTVAEHNGYVGDAFNALHPIVRAIIGSVSTLRKWREMPSETLESVISSNFQKSYRERVKEKQDYEALPADVRRLYDTNGRAKFLNGNTEPELPPRRKKYIEAKNEYGEEITLEVSAND